MRINPLLRVPGCRESPYRYAKTACRLSPDSAEPRYNHSKTSGDAKTCGTSTQKELDFVRAGPEERISRMVGGKSDLHWRYWLQGIYCAGSLYNGDLDEETVLDHSLTALVGWPRDTYCTVADLVILVMTRISSRIITKSTRTV